MAQIFFGSDSTCANGDLDANFTELYGKTAWATTGIGYATGAGGAVTQATSKTTAVTLNKVCGQITMNAASLAAGATASFVLNNSIVASSDCIVVNVANITVAPANYRVRAAPGVGTVVISVENVSGGALAEAVVLNFVVIKSVTA